MLRTAFLTSVAALGLATTGSAQVVYFPQVGPSYRANYAVVQQDFRRRGYEVEFRTCRAERWRTYTVTRNHQQAHAIARHLRMHGFQARVNH